MAATQPQLLSGRAKVASYDNLVPSRYQFLSLDQAEPSLGTAAVGNILTIGVGNSRVWTNEIVIQRLDLSDGNVSNINTISGSSITGNITLEPVGNGMVNINAITGLIMPVGDTSERPANAVAGTTRFNTDSDRLEVYDGSEWDTISSGITNQIIVADGTNTTYALDRASTAAAALVSINGIVQIPGISYSYTITGNLLAFADPPLPGDVIDIRFL